MGLTHLSHLIYPLTARVVGAPQIISQTVSSIHFSLFSTAPWDLANSRPVHSLTLSFRLFLCLPWSGVMFSDELKLVLGRRDGRQRVWRRTGDRYQPPAMIAVEVEVSLFGERSP